MKTARRLILVFAGVLGVSLLGQPARAQTAEAGRVYLGIGVGPIVPQAVTSNLTGAISGSGKVEFNASGFVGLVAGYRAAEHFAIDAEAGWTLYDSHDLVGAFSGTAGPLPGDIPLNGDMHTWLGLANFEYRPRHASARLAPYFGPSIGAAGLEWLLDSRPGGNIVLGLRGGSTSFAAGALAGIDYALTKRFSLGGRYNFVHVATSGPTISGGGITLSHSTPEIHLLQMIGTYRFSRIRDRVTSLNSCGELSSSRACHRCLTAMVRWHINEALIGLRRKFMRGSLFAALALASAFLVARPVAAHHGFSVEFDDSKPITLTGTVTKMEFMNPHIYFYLDVKDARGKVVNWSFEGSPPNILYRQGWRKDTIKPGDVITANGFRARDGAHLVACTKVKFQDGHELQAGAGNVKAYDKN